MMRNVLAAASVAALLAACSPADPAAAPDTAAPASAPTAPADTAAEEADLAGVLAVAELAATAGNAVTGSLQFRQVDGQLHVSGTVSGLKPGSEHGFHIHETGDCSAADGSSAGGHFNPSAAAHGAIDAAVHHTGDMPNLKADDQGTAVVDGPLSAEASLGDGGSHDILGRGLIVHADPDDYTSQPTGNAGARLACAVISRPAATP